MSIFGPLNYEQLAAYVQADPLSTASSPKKKRSNKKNGEEKKPVELKPSASELTTLTLRMMIRGAYGVYPIAINIDLKELQLTHFDNGTPPEVEFKFNDCGPFMESKDLSKNA